MFVQKLRKYVCFTLECSSSAIGNYRTMKPHSTPPTPNGYKRGVPNFRLQLSFCFQEVQNSPTKQTTMNFLKSLLTFTKPRNPKINFINDLPTEISQMILSHLDSQSLLNAALVSRKWLSVCKSTSTFRRKIRGHIRRGYRMLPPIPLMKKRTNNHLKPKHIFIAHRRCYYQFKPQSRNNRP